MTWRETIRNICDVTLKQSVELNNKSNSYPGSMIIIPESIDNNMADLWSVWSAWGPEWEMSEEEEEEGGQGQEGRSGKEEEDKPDNKVGLDFQHSRGPLKCWVISA